MAQSLTPDFAGDFPYSVVVPAHNDERTIELALRSVLDQTILPSQVIVIDDGSTDQTCDVARSISSPLIAIARQPNAGPGAARNRGIEIARSEWIAFLDADDLWAPEHAASLRNVSSRFPNANLIAGGYREVMGEAPSKLDAGGVDHCFIIDFFEGPGLSPIHTSAAAIRRNFAQFLGGFSTIFPGEDVDLWFRSALLSEVAMSRRVTSYYVRRRGSIMDESAGVVRNFRKQPVLGSIDRALADPNRGAVRAKIIRYRDKLYRSLLRQAIAHSDPGIGREIVRRMRQEQVTVPFWLALCSITPRPAVATANAVRRALFFPVASHGR